MCNILVEISLPGPWPLGSAAMDPGPAAIVPGPWTDCLPGAFLGAPPGSPAGPGGCLNYSLDGPGKTADFRPPGGLPMERVKIRYKPCRSDSTPLVQIGIYGVSSFGRCRSDSRRPFSGSSGESIASLGLDVCSIFQPLAPRGVQGGWLLLRIGSFQAKSCRVDSTPCFGPKLCIKRPSWEVMRG